MKKIAMLIARIPNPRTLKRIKVLERFYDITLLYWDRGLDIKEEFEINKKNTVKQILVRAPQGKPLARIIPLMKFSCISLRILKFSRPNIIHAENLDMLFIASIYKFLFDRKTKIIYEVADLPKYTFVKRIRSPRSLIARFLQQVEKKLTSSISKLILTSPYYWDEYFSKFIDRDKYLFIPNAPSRNLFNKYKKKQNRNFTIGFIGSVRYVKQLKMLIDAVGEIDEDVKVFIAGSGPGYEDILEYSKGKDYIEMYGPYNYEKEIINLYEKVDCVYAVYDTKLNNVKIALPNRLYEAIVCEIPIIAAKGTKLGQFIEENKIGITVNDNDKEELKDALRSLTKEKLIFYQQNCNRIKSNYYYEENSKKLLDVYKNL